MESDAIGYLDEYCMMVIMQTDSYSAMTASSLTGMTSQIKILFVNSVTNLVFAFSLNHNQLNNIDFIGHLTVWFEH